LKLLGAASDEHWSFERCVELGNQINSYLVTIGTSLDHCHIPGRAHYDQVADDACVLGMGIHNEPGLQTISPMPSPEEIVKKMLLFLLDPKDTDRAFVAFNPEDETTLLINNFGGLSTLETEALTNITLTQLSQDWGIKPVRVFSGLFETSLNGPGFSISLGNFTGLAKEIKSSTSELLRLLDAPTTAPAWPKNGYRFTPTEHRNGNSVEAATTSVASTSQEGPTVSPKSLEQVINNSCQAALDAEPLITKYDIQMGDGDCGEAVAGACNAVLSLVKRQAFDNTSSFLEQMTLIAEVVEDIGGSLFAIISILLTAFTNALRSQYASGTLSIEQVSMAVGPAIENLKGYTSARVGGRTVMDTLIPFCEVLKQTQNLEEATKAAVEGAKKTAGMKAKFGRATYVGDKADELQETPPDPGAYALAVFLRALVDGIAKIER
jgi:dihydroxyacetone kinase